MENITSLSANQNVSVANNSSPEDFPSQPAASPPLPPSFPAQPPAPPPVPSSGPLPFESLNPPLAQANTAAPISQNITPLPRKKRWLWLLLLLVFILIGSFSGLTWAVAYEKIDLGNPGLQKNVTNLVLSLPFTPKTPKYIVESSIRAHKNLKKQSFKISIAAESNNFSNLINTNKLDLEMKGNIDYSDTKNPQFSLNASITKEFNVDIVKKDALVYFKVNKYPSEILSIFGINSGPIDSILLNKWFSYDSTPLNTEARKYLDENKEQKSLVEGSISENLKNFLDEKIFKSIVVSSEDFESHPTYRLRFAPSAEVIDDIGQIIEEERQKDSKYKSDESDAGLNSNKKLSNYLKSLTVDFWFDKSKYYIRNIVISMKLTVSTDAYSGISNMIPGGFGTLSLPEDKETLIVAAAKFNNFGEAFNIETPKESMTMETLVNLLTEELRNNYPVETPSSEAVPEENGEIPTLEPESENI